MKKKILIFLPLILIISFSCKGQKESPPPPVSLLSFQPTLPSASDNSITLNSYALNAVERSISLAIKANNISSPAFAAAFDLDFDPQIIQLDDSFIRGDFFEKNINPERVEYLLSEEGGKAVLGISRTAGDGGVTGEGTLIILKFKVIRNGTSALSFSQANLLNDSTPLPETIKNITWQGGEITAQGKKEK